MSDDAQACPNPEHGRLPRIRLHVHGLPLDPVLARDLAERAASEVAPEPMLLSWYDGQKGEEHPPVTECSSRPGWIEYGESHGGHVWVVLNDGEFGFIFMGTGDLG